MAEHVRAARAAGAVALIAALAWTPRAEAYPWMVAHKYTSCNQCHVDPSGAGALTSYGRALGEQLLPRGGGEDSTQQPGKEKDFLLGAVALPRWMNLQADVRALGFPQPTLDANGEIDAWTGRFLLMQSDLRAAVEAGPVVAYASAGVVDEGAQAAWLTSNDSGWNAVSRDYWVGWKAAKGVLVRAGRMNLPFGIRTEEHTQYVRTATRTGMNADQQAGVAISAQKKGLRGEAMLIAGNPQVAPDTFRERGYSAFTAWAPTKTLEVGASSLYATSETDVATLAALDRQAHGMFARWSPAPRVAVLAEADVLRADSGATTTNGVATLAEVDWQAVQGLHLRGIGQFCDPDLADDAAGLATAWVAAQWFVAPRVDVRVDALHGTLRCEPGIDPRWYGLGQLHFYL
jgi:hypothetical protein